MKYHLITYGCQMNTADSEEMAQPLKDLGFLATGSLRDADIVLMNTCTVREQAEHRADSNIGRLRVWKAKDPNRILIVAGCAASRWGDSIKKKYPFIDLVSPATRIEQFPEAVAQVLKERWNWEEETSKAFEEAKKRRSQDAMRSTPPFSSSLPPSVPSSPFIFGSDDSAYVTIMRGCNYRCAYCIVPQVRGREVYRPMPEILDEIRAKTAQGYREVMLLGQTVNSYYWRPGEEGKKRGREEGKTSGSEETKNGSRSDLSSSLLPFFSSSVVDFADLLRAVDAVPGVERIRFMSPHPRHMREPVIQAMAESRKVCRHIHLPLQSGSDRLLAAMKRLYTIAEYAQVVGQLRSAMPGIAITTDVIVGYPGETESEFQDTLTAIRDLRFNGLFAFKYSPRPGTDSASAEDDVPDAVKERRLQSVLAVNDENKTQYRTKVNA